MTELEVLYASVQQNLIRHPKNPGVSYRLFSLTLMHRDGEWVKAFSYQEAGKYNAPIYTRPVDEFTNFMVVENTGSQTDF